MNDSGLPVFPRPDLPISAPENYPVLQIRVRRRRGLPDDGGLWIHDALADDVLNGFNGTVISDSGHGIELAFESMHDAVAWAGDITTAGRDRDMVRFTTPPASPYQAARLTVQPACAACDSADLVDRKLRWETSPAGQVDFETPERCERCRSVLCDSCAFSDTRHDRPGTETECLPA